MSTLWITAHGQRLLVEGDRFAAEGAPERTVDLGSGYVIPGLWDAHLHLLHWCRRRDQVDLTGCLSSQDFLRRVERAGPGAWIQGQGYTEAFPTVAELDAVTGNRPALFWRADLHSALCNSAALSLAGIDADTPDPPGGQILFHEGRLLELAIELVSRWSPDHSEAELDRQFREGSRHLLSLGVTAFTDQRIKNQPDGVPSRAAFKRLRLPQRIFCNVAAYELGSPLPEPDGYHTGHVKFFSDGSLGSHTCKMLDPAPWEGIWMSEPAELREGFARARAAGMPICVHAIGDLAVRVCLDLLEELGPSPLPVPDRMEHVQLLDLQDLPRIARLNLTCSMQPLHLVDDKELSERVLGARSESYYRLASLHRTGARFAFGSDGPVADVNPWLGLHAAVHHWNHPERLPLQVALEGYTRGAALSVGRPDLGSLEPGCLADFVVLDRVPTADNLLEVRVLRTVVGGETVYTA